MLVKPITMYKTINHFGTTSIDNLNKLGLIERKIQFFFLLNNYVLTNMYN